MTALQRKLNYAQRRLWVNRCLSHLGWTLLVAAGLWLLTLVVERLLGLRIPLGIVAIGLTGAALVAAIVWSALTRESSLDAAVALDRAAGLKERVSTGLYCSGQGDPFAQAVVQDALRASEPLSVRRFIPLRWARSLTYGAVGVAVALVGLGLFPKFDLLGRAKADERRAAQREQVRAMQASLAKPVEAVKQLAESNPALKDNEALQDLEKLARQQNPVSDPADLRREAIKKIEKLSDDLKRQSQSDRFNDVQDMKKRLSTLTPPNDPKSPTGKLMQALASGDMKTAQQELKKMQEQLAKRDRSGASDNEMKKMSAQLDDLAKKLNDISRDKNFEQQMQKAGLSQEDMKRVLEALAKKDPKQLEKMAKELEQKMKQQGMSQQQIDKLKQQMQQQAQKQQSQQSCQKLAQQLQQAASQCKSGNCQGAGQQLSEAAEQLSQMEQMQQELAEMQSNMANLDQLKDKMGEGSEQQNEGEQDEGECKECSGSGFKKDGSPCGQCNSKGNGKGGRGRGSGARKRGSGDVAFETKRANVKQRGGQVIGQWFVKGEQIKGEAKAEFLDATDSAVRDATDALQKDQVPKAYQRAVKSYFDRLGADQPDGRADEKQSPDAKPADTAGEKPDDKKP